MPNASASGSATTPTVTPATTSACHDRRSPRSRRGEGEAGNHLGHRGDRGVGDGSRRTLPASASSTVLTIRQARRAGRRAGLGLRQRADQDALGHREQLDELRVADRVDDRRPLLAGRDQPGPAQHAELLGQVRRLDADQRLDLADRAPLASTSSTRIRAGCASALNSSALISEIGRLEAARPHARAPHLPGDPHPETPAGQTRPRAAPDGPDFSL